MNKLDIFNFDSVGIDDREKRGERGRRKERERGPLGKEGERGERLREREVRGRGRRGDMI